MVALKSFIDKYTSAGYKSDFISIFLSKIFISLISFFVTPILARIYGPADYGLFGLVNSMAVTLALVANLTLPVSILVMEEAKVYARIASIISYSLIVNAIFLCIGLILVSTADVELTKDLHITSEIVVITCVSAFLLTLTQILANLNIRYKAFKKNVVVSVMENISIRMASLLFGVMGFLKLGLFYAELVGKVVNILKQILGTKIRLQDVRYLFNIDDMRETFRAHKHYPLYNLPVTLLSNFTTQIVIWVLALFFAKDYVGYFTMSVGFLSIPLLLFSNSFQPLITKKLVDEPSFTFFVNMSLKIFFISAAIYATIFALSPFFIRVYLGDKWMPCVPIIKLLCIPFLFVLLGSSISGAFIALNKQRTSLIIKAGFLLLLLAVLYLQVVSHADLAAMTGAYALIVSTEEIAKIFSIGLILKNVRSN